MPPQSKSLSYATALYLLKSLHLATPGTPQQLRAWIKDCRSPQSGHESLSFLHRWRFELWGSVSTAALRANFICSLGRDWIALAQIVAVSGVVALSISPCLSRLFTRFRLGILSSTLPFAAESSAFWEVPGSSTIASCTIIAGLNFFLVRRVSACSYFSAMCLTQGSGEVRS